MVHYVASHVRVPNQRGCTTRLHVLLRCIALSMVSLFIIGSAASITLWLSLHPRLPAIQAESFSLSGFNLSGPLLTAKYKIELYITNPNKKIDLQISQFGLSLMYRGAPLSRIVKVFSPASLTILRNGGSEVEFEDRLKDKTRKQIIGSLEGDWTKGFVTFNVKMKVGVKFRAYAWLTKQKALVVTCKNLNVVFVQTHSGKDRAELPDGQNSSCIIDYE
ncbi:hypothetical protein SAY86_008175 [Trapa natans]|uniref:Late embryogenesis abundant protein LEA-2 subgroup domain-containing protein n=1 Tax=Trapa natans TaxID=22666 RepID=A0AAN7QAI6_TRANT|nr:hypothetical protein SAY86_008175 [Trapa natans]